MQEGSLIESLLGGPVDRGANVYTGYPRVSGLLSPLLSESATWSAPSRRGAAYHTPTEIKRVATQGTKNS